MSIQRRKLLGCALALTALCVLTLGSRRLRAEAQAPSTNANRPVHDPCIARDGDTYYVFCTGPGIPIRRSKDLVHWEAAGQVFPEPLPAWAREAVPGSTIPWAPDIAYFNGRYYLYYSVSTFGKNRSLIGLVTNKTLDPRRKEYAWKDEGKVFESQRSDNFNAIDSNVLRVGKRRMVLTFGSFWSGLKLVEADPKSGKPLPGAEVRALARRPSPDALEAPFLVRHGKDFYLFASYDFCCRGVNSTYNIKVGRSKQPEGPYLDRDGKPLLEDGGTSVLQTQGRFIGPGHCAILQEKGRDLLVHHFYDGESRGIPTLQVRPLTWDKEGWPVAGEPLGQ
jgi:arabinan endo-1,5-alpha-L-arabinosidase